MDRFFTESMSVCGDGAGTVYTCTQNPGASGLLLSKWNGTTGVILWNRTCTGRGNDIWVDAAGDVYVCGADQNTTAADEDLFIAKWNPAGTQLWNRTWTGGTTDSASSIWGDTAGGIFTCNTVKSIAYSEMVVTRWNATGGIVWNKTTLISGYAGDTIGMGVWGYGDMLYTCGASPRVDQGIPFSKEAALVGWNASTGEQLWFRTWETTTIDVFNAVWCNAVDVYVCGTTGAPEPGKTIYDNASELLLVKWVPNTPPVIDHPADIVLPYSGLTEQIYWNVSDTSAASGYAFFVVRRDGVLVQNCYTVWQKSIPNGCYLAFSLPVGEYFVYVYIIDEEGGHDNDTRRLTITNVGPTITHPDDRSYEAGSVGHSISWTITDASTSSRNYTISIDGVATTTGTWTTGASVNCSIVGLAVGEHDCSIVATDGYGGTTGDVVTVTVTEATSLATVPGFPAVLVMGFLAAGVVWASRKIIGASRARSPPCVE
jgi:hypothetical protein